MTCETCGLSFEPKPQRSGRFCSVECFWARGPDGPRQASVKGFRMRTLRDHPLAPPSGVLPVSRIVLYEKIGPGPHPCHWCGRLVNWGRGITTDGLIADHLDWDHTNDDPANLVPSCNSCNTRRAAPGRQGAIQAYEPTFPISNGYRTRAVQCTCGTCGKEFLATKSRPRLYCSRPCYHASRVGQTRKAA
jgi:hypothetical protein